MSFHSTRRIVQVGFAPTNTRLVKLLKSLSLLLLIIQHLSSPIGICVFGDFELFFGSTTSSIVSFSEIWNEEKNYEPFPMWSILQVFRENFINVPVINADSWKTVEF